MIPRVPHGTRMHGNLVARFYADGPAVDMILDNTREWRGAAELFESATGAARAAVARKARHRWWHALVTARVKRGTREGWSVAMAFHGFGPKYDTAPRKIGPFPTREIAEHRRDALIDVVRDAVHELGVCVDDVTDVGDMRRIHVIGGGP